MNISDALNKVWRKEDLTESEARTVLDTVFQGAVDQAQLADLLTALAAKGESASEIIGFVKEMRAQMRGVNAPGAIDIVGTGGDGSGTFNISTASAFVAVGAGAKVAKHGNKAASSKCGSANVLESLGVNIQLSPEQAASVFDAGGMVFMMAPLFHPAMKSVAEVRSKLRIRTIFNILGPLANPASTRKQLIGVPNMEIAGKMAEAAKSLQYEYALFVTSEDGMDEISLSAKTHALEVKDGKVTSYDIDPEALGFRLCSRRDLLGGDASENAHMIRNILDGEKGPRRDVVVLNTAFALKVAGIAAIPQEGITLAERSIDSGAAKSALERLIKDTNTFAIV